MEQATEVHKVVRHQGYQMAVFEIFCDAVQNARNREPTLQPVRFSSACVLKCWDDASCNWEGDVEQC
jgi:hypothetical protein